MRSNIDRIRDALSFVSPDTRDTWVNMGMAIKSELGDPGFDVWDEWSRQSDSYSTGDAERVWKSIRANGGVTVGTLFHEASAGGWRDDGKYPKPTFDELAERNRIAAERAAREQTEIARERTETAKKASEIWKAATETRPDHHYLQRKQVGPVATMREIDAASAATILGYAPKSGGEPLTGRLLVIPVKQGGTLSTLELIDGDGRKVALAGRGSKVGGYWATEPLPDVMGTLLIGEGVATAISANEASGFPAIAALSAGNLPTVVQALRELHPSAELVILADLVKATGEPEPHAVQAAQAVGGKLAIPVFDAPRDPDLTDFNDMALKCGSKAVEEAIQRANGLAEGYTHPGMKGTPAGVSGWPEPQPLTARVEPEPYPVDALPGIVRAAVEEVVRFVKAPVAMVASSALSALSLATQAHVDVKRAERLQGPVGLFLLTIADSGERKSTCDDFFTSAIRQYQDEQAEVMKPTINEFQSELAAWEAERDGILSAIKAAGRSGKPTDEHRADLAKLQCVKPESPRVPKVILGDETPENLAWGLAKHWPSAGVVSAEAGTVFGAHGMGKDSVMRNLGLLNVLWDGGSHSVGRRTSESFTVKGVRLTVALQIQEPTLRSFFDRSGGLARGTGFLARFLVAWPESTQGFRPFTEAPPDWPYLKAFNQRIAEILANPVPMDEDGVLSPALLMLAPDAKAAWVTFHDAIERELASGGDLYDVRDVASKSADNAARLAALFQIFEHGMGGAIGLECFESASRIAAWHLNESRRFFDGLALPKELADAVMLDRWLLDYCRRVGSGIVRRREVQQNVTPVHLRQKGPLDAALSELIEAGRVRLVHEGRRKEIHVNPALLNGGAA